jgi:hypothetical protein
VARAAQQAKAAPVVGAAQQAKAAAPLANRMA